jgi:hypothetical protein
MRAQFSYPLFEHGFGNLPVILQSFRLQTNGFLGLLSQA